MNNEISEALANNARQRAFRRLERDGAHSTTALQRRVRALAQERNIPPADIHKLMYKRISTRDVIVFCEKYNVNCDWLLCGDLKGLKLMIQDQHLSTMQSTPEGLKDKLARLSESQRDIVRKVVDNLLEGAS